MNEYKINTDIISTTGITIDSRYIPMSTGKVVINNVEVTDIDSWNKAISTFSELENKINNLQSKIDKINLFKLYLQERLLKHKDEIERGINEFDERNECEDILNEFINFFKED